MSNKTHYSPTDPDARISVKPGQARALNSQCSLAVDTAQGIISHVQADFADSCDSLHLPGLLTGLQKRFAAHELRMRDLLADAGYANGPNYALLESQGVTAWIPVFGQYKPETEGFTYDRATDQYTCPAGKPLPFQKHDTNQDGPARRGGLHGPAPFQKHDTNQDGGWHKIYWAAYSDCQHCPLKATCAPKARRKQLTKTIYDAAYRRAWQRQQTRRGQRLRRVRQATVEPVCGNLIHHYGLRRMNVRGLAGAHKTMLLKAVAFNLKKLLRFRPQQHQSAVIALPHPLSTPDTRFYLRSRRAGRCSSSHPEVEFSK